MELIIYVEYLFLSSWIKMESTLIDKLGLGEKRTSGVPTQRNKIEKEHNSPSFLEFDNCRTAVEAG